MSLIISTIQTLACVYILFVSILALNAMTHETAFPIRMAHIALVAGSVAGVLSSLVARDVFECIFVLGIALYLKGNRRASQH